MDINSVINNYKNLSVKKFLNALNDNTRCILVESKSLSETLPTKAIYLRMKSFIDGKTVKDVSLCEDVIGYESIVILYE